MEDVPKEAENVITTQPKPKPDEAEEAKKECIQKTVVDGIAMIHPTPPSRTTVFCCITNNDSDCFCCYGDGCCYCDGCCDGDGGHHDNHDSGGCCDEGCCDCGDCDDCGDCGDCGDCSGCDCDCNF